MKVGHEINNVCMLVYWLFRPTLIKRYVM